MDPHSKHNIIHGSVNLSIPRPPPYKRNIYDYKTANTDQIHHKLLNLNWHDLFSNLNEHEKALVFLYTFLDIMVKHIPNETITCNDSDTPWITHVVKTAIKGNSRVYRKWINRGKNSTDHVKVREVRNLTNKLIKEAKLAYYTNLGNKLSDHAIWHKQFWTAYKKIADKKRNTNIPPIIDNDIYISNSEKKADIFNEYFANQCTINDNGSVLPRFVSKTDELLTHVSVRREQIISIINHFSPNKAHGYDRISVSMLKLCAAKIAAPLQIIFQDCINSGTFPGCWKYANVQSIHKKITVRSKVTIDPFHCYPFVAKVLRKSSLTKFMLF